MSQDSPSSKTFSVDREKTTPFLIRVFVHRGRHFDDAEYRDPSNLPKSGQIHIHTWMDATLLELKKLLTEVVPELKKPNYDASLSFALVYPDRKGTMVVKKCGNVIRIDRNNHNKDAQKTLKQLKFEIGDFLDVSIETIKSNNFNGNNVNDNRYGRSYGMNNNNNSYSRYNNENSYGGNRSVYYRGGYRGGYRGRGRGRSRGGYRGRGRGFDRGFDRRRFSNSRPRHFD
eukprot:UN00054